MQPAQPKPRVPSPTRPVNYGRTAPGTHLSALGDKMRTETSQALEQLLKQGSLTTGLEGLLAKVAMNIGPSTAVHPEAMHPQYAARAAARNVANQSRVQAQGVVPLSQQRLPMHTPQGAPVGAPAVGAARNDAAMQMRTNQHAWERANDPLMAEVHGMADHALAHGSLPTPAAAPSAPSALQRFGQGASNVGGRIGRGIGKGLLWGGLGTAGALALGLGAQNEEDARHERLVYAPLGGGMY